MFAVLVTNTIKYTYHHGDSRLYYLHDIINTMPKRDRESVFLLISVALHSSSVVNSLSTGHIILYINMSRPDVSVYL